MHNGHNINYNPQKQIQKITTEKLMEEGIHCSPFVLLCLLIFKRQNLKSTEKTFFLFIRIKKMSSVPFSSNHSELQTTKEM